METIDKVALVKELYNYSYNELAASLHLSGTYSNKLRFDEVFTEDKLDEFSVESHSKLNFLFNRAKPESSKIPSGKQFRFIDLFAGIGGMRLGFEKNGGHCVFSSEIDPYPSKLYEQNFKERPAGDIKKIPASMIPEHDILLAGFPCQPFSLAGVSKSESMGSEHGVKCETRGTLFFDVARIIEFHKPKMFLLENVKNLKGHDKGKTYETIYKVLTEDLGYRVTEKVINANLLVPQSRERIYIVGTLDHDEPFEFPEIRAKRKNDLGDILEDSVDSKYTLTKGTWNALKNHAEKHRKKGNGFGYGLNDGTGYSRTLSARYYKDGAEILIKQRYRRPRRLTPRECARLMGFPNSYKIDSVSDLRAYKCFGNSVVVPIIDRIAKQMIKSSIIQHNIELSLNYEK